ncbi:MAG: ADP-ribosylglycohydrolase family protein [Candidatus Bathyarchaeia archaeon]|nr:ADP-ribosylglycohydrolase family protein [Candidatus Bathyarchaeota archaeon]
MAVAAAVAEAFNPKATVDSIIDASKAYLPKRSEVLIGIEYAMKLAHYTKDYIKFRELYYKGLEAEIGEPIADPRPIIPLEARYGSKRYTIDPRETVPVALAIFWLAEGDPVETFINCANFGRDSDTIGNIVGSIAGAFKGADAFPQDWVDTVQKVNQPDQIELSRQQYYIITKMMQQSEERLQTLKNNLIG